MKTLRCREVGFDCDGVIRAETEEEILLQAVDHAKTVHNLSEISELGVEKIRTLIHDEWSERTSHRVVELSGLPLGIAASWGEPADWRAVRTEKLCGKSAGGGKGSAEGCSSHTEEKKEMNTRKAFLIAILFVLAISVVACAQPTAEPAKALPTVAPRATDAPKLTTAPTVAPTTAPAAFDIKPVLDKYVTALPDGFGGVQPAALKDQMAAAKPFILDVREASEITTNGFIEGSVNIPIRTLMKNIDKLPAKDQPIVTLCASGQRGGIAMSVLQVLGYTNVKNLVGGFGAWKAATFPVASGTPAEAKAGKAPEFDKDLVAALDKYVTTLPDGFGSAQPAALKDQMAATKVFLLDVREVSEITQNGFLEGSVNVPMRTLVKNLDKLPGDKTAPIVTYCPSGQRGVIAMTTLQLLGYSNVKNLVGGFGAWKTAGYQTK